MAKSIRGVNLQRYNGYAVCHITGLSEDLKNLIRKHLSVICHGSHASDYLENLMYCYRSTVKSFIERYDKKKDETKKGMVGELLSHIIITTLFDEYSIVSAFFNLEEKSIKKGFDILLFNIVNNTVWITEVKSGNMHAGKTHDQTTAILLNTAKTDLIKRLNEQETQYWYNAINHVRVAVRDEDDHRSVLLKILREKHGKDAATGKAKSQDKNVVLISNLFAPLSTKVSHGPVQSLAVKLKAENVFSEILVFSIQKATYQKIIAFLQAEIK